MVEILFSLEKVPYDVSKNKLVLLKERRDLGLVWKLLALDYGHYGLLFSSTVQTFCYVC